MPPTETINKILIGLAIGLSTHVLGFVFDKGVTDIPRDIRGFEQQRHYHKLTNQDQTKIDNLKAKYVEIETKKLEVLAQVKVGKKRDYNKELESQNDKLISNLQSQVSIYEESLKVAENRVEQLRDRR